MRFDRDQTFHLTNVERLNISFVFRDVECCSMRLTGHCTFFSVGACAVLARSSAKFSARLTTQQLNIAKQHSTLLNKCPVLFSQNVQYV